MVRAYIIAIAFWLGCKGGEASKAETPGPSAPAAAKTLSKAPAPCDLISKEEIAGIVGEPVTIKDDESGADAEGLGGACYWRRANASTPAALVNVLVTPGGNPMLQNEPSDEKLAGLGEKAYYHWYGTIPGGAVLVKRANVKVVVDSDAGKDRGIAVAKLVMTKLGI